MVFHANTLSIQSLFFYLITVFALMGCGGGGGSSTPAVTIDSLSQTAVPRTLVVGETFQLDVIGTYSDASTESLNSQITWNVADNSVLSISNSGLVTALSAGSTSVRASFDGVSVQQTISVKALADLSISPNSLTLAINSSQQLSVTGLYTDNSTEDFSDLVSWSSSNSGVASVSNTGQVEANTAGSISISASLGSISTSVNVDVSPATLESIVLSSPLTQLAEGLTVQFSAKGIYSDGTEQTITNDVDWSVSNGAFASIDSETGLLSAVQAGSMSVVASKASKNGSFLLTVSPATLSELSITPAVTSLAAGTSTTINVTAIFSDNSKQDVSDQVVWANTDEAIAVIGSNSSSLQALSVGSTVLTASLSGQSADLTATVTNAELESLTLSPVNTSVPKGLDAQFTAQGIYTDQSVQDVTEQVTWLSGNESVAVVSNNQGFVGLADMISEGSTTITAVLGSIQQQTSLTVELATLSSIEVQPSNQTVANGTDATVTAFGYYSDGSQIDVSDKVIWSVSQPSLVDLSSVSEGIVHSLGEGGVLLSAELGGKSGLANITISSASLETISIEAPQTSLANGFNQTLVARASYSDGSTKDISKQVTWQSSDTSVLTISNVANEAGLLRANGVGQARITAALGEKSGQIDIDVTSAVLQSLQVTSSSVQLNVSETASASALATYSDSSTQDVTEQVNWASNDLEVASIENNALTKGKITGMGVGSTSIAASLNGISSNALAIQVALDPNVPKALNLNVQPNIILNDGNDASTLTLTLVPTGQTGSVPDGTPMTLTITEGDSTRVENLSTVNGMVTYPLQTSTKGFISLSATSGDLTSSSGLIATDDFTDAIAAQGQARVLYENNTLRAGSKFIVLLRNLSNRDFDINQIDIFYFDPNNSNTRTDFPESPLIDDGSTSNGDLVGGEFTFIGYGLDSDLEASNYVITYLLSDQASNTNFGLSAQFDFSQ